MILLAQTHRSLIFSVCISLAGALRSDTKGAQPALQAQVELKVRNICEIKQGVFCLLSSTTAEKQEVPQES